MMRNHSFKTFENKLKNNTDAYMEIIQENIIISLLLPLDSLWSKIIHGVLHTLSFTFWQEFKVRCLLCVSGCIECKFYLEKLNRSRIK